MKPYRLPAVVLCHSAATVRICLSMFNFKIIMQIIMTPENVPDRQLNSAFDLRNVAQKKNQVGFY